MDWVEFSKNAAQIVGVIAPIAMSIMGWKYVSISKANAALTKAVYSWSISNEIPPEKIESLVDKIDETLEATARKQITSTIADLIRKDDSTRSLSVTATDNPDDRRRSAWATIAHDRS